jgi:hypothetical protein
MMAMQPPPPDPRWRRLLTPVHLKPKGWLSQLPCALLLFPRAPIALAVVESSHKTSFIQALGFGSCRSKFGQYGRLFIGGFSLISKRIRSWSCFDPSFWLRYASFRINRKGMNSISATGSDSALALWWWRSLAGSHATEAARPLHELCAWWWQNKPVGSIPKWSQAGSARLGRLAEFVPWPNKNWKKPF